VATGTEVLQPIVRTWIVVSMVSDGWLMFILDSCSSRTKDLEDLN
jgi:hypothetical protein